MVGVPQHRRRVVDEHHDTVGVTCVGEVVQADLLVAGVLLRVGRRRGSVSSFPWRFGVDSHCRARGEGSVGTTE